MAPDHHVSGEFDLVRPTDFEILWVVKSGQRFTAPVVASLLDKQTDYISSQMGRLADQSLLTSIGDVQRCKLYRITPAGAVALTHVDAYERNNAAMFTTLTNQISSYLRADFDSAGPRTEISVPPPSPITWHPNMVLPETRDLNYLTKIASIQPATPQDLFSTGDRFEQIATQLYRLEYFGVLHSTGSAYELTDLGQTLDEIVSSSTQFDTGGRWSELTYLRLQAALESRGVLDVPEWYDPDAFTESALNQTLPTTIPDFTQSK